MTAADTRRIAFTLHYDGEPYHGWQLQRGQPSVQGAIEAVLARLFGGPARVIGSGRTDRGVHATGQVAAVDAPARWEPEALRRALNALLPESIWIANAAEVTHRFHPRYDAISRRYIYRIGIADVAASPFHARWCWPLGRKLDESAMAAATLAIIGDHSFKGFAKSGQEERGDRCVVSDAGWAGWADIGIEFHITANRFLHHMVRYLVGTLADIGLGRRPAADIARLLQGGSDLVSSPPAPAPGLFLAEVRYHSASYASSFVPEGESDSTPTLEPTRRPHPNA